MRKLLSFILILMCPLFISFILPPPAKADTLFYDNFDDGNPDGWKTYDNGTGIKNLWKVEKINQNYMYGITIDINYAQTWAVAGEFSWSDYIYEVEILPISGTDKNIIWRVKDPNHFYALHMRGNLIGIRKIGSNPGNYWPADVNYTVLNGIKYKLIMKSLGKHLQVSISNGNSTVILFDFEDVEEPYLNGAIGLYASTGADRPTSVWFDEVKVEFIENVPHFPLILIPGHGACFNREAIVYGKQETNQEDWKFWPFLHEYDGLIKSIENSGYQLNSDLFLFCYDWRKKIDQTADILKNFISNKVLKNRSDVDRVKIIGHSMGGLIGRTFSQKYYGSGLEQLITVGTPHQGVIQSYYAWEGGQPFGEKNFSWLAWQILIQTQKKGFKTNIETVRETAPSTLNLFPTFNFLKNQNGEEKDIKLMNWKNEWLLNLNQSLPDLFSTKFNSLIGIKGDTPSAFIITQRDWLDEILNRWEDGKPI